MTEKLIQVLEVANDVCGSSIQLPPPPPDQIRRLEALRAAGLQIKAADCLFGIRCQQARELGFCDFSPEEVVEMLMGEPHTHTDYGIKHFHEYVFDHHSGQESLGEQCRWDYRTELYTRKVRSRLRTTTAWECIHGGLDYLAGEIPYGIVLRLNELKAAKLFNAFSVVAPAAAFRTPEEIDPILIGQIWTLPPLRNKSGEIEITGSGEIKNFVLASWGKSV